MRLALPIVALLCISLPVLAADAVPTLTLGASAAVHVVPPGKITADGKRISLTLVVSDERGALADNVSFKGTGVTQGRLDASECKQVGRGTYTCPFTTPEDAGLGTADLKIKARLTTGSMVDTSYPLTILPEAKGKLQIAATPERIVLSQDVSAALSVTIQSPSGRPLEGIRIGASSNVGSVAGVISLGGGKYQATFTPPATQFPQVAIVSFWDQDEPERIFGFVRIPLVGKVAYPVQAGQPGVSLTFKIGDQTFPPSVTDATGMARVPITVPPGVSEATVDLVTPQGAKTTQKIDLQVPPFNRLALGGLPAFLPADGRSETKVRVMVVDRFGKLADGQPVQMTTTLGELSPVQFIGNGIYEANFKAPMLDTSSKASISVSIAGEETVSAAVAEIALEPSAPDGLQLVADPAVITPNVTKATLTATLINDDGKTSTSHGVEFRTIDGPVKNPKTVSPGVFSAELPVKWDVKTVVQAIVGAKANRQAVAGIVALPLTDLVLTGQKVPVTVIAVDHFGNPVANTPINVAVQAGGGSVTPNVQTDNRGLGAILYTAGPLPGLATVTFTANGQSYTAPIWQSVEPVDNFSLPVSGGQDQGRLLARWKKLRQTVVLGGSSTQQQTAQATTATPWGAAPVETTAQVEKDKGSVARSAAARIEVTAIPGSVPEAGGTVNLLVRVVDANNVLVPGEKVILLSDGGTLGNKMDNGDGTHSAILTVPANLGRASLQVTATRPQGDLASFVQVGIGGVAAQQPKATKPVKEPVAKAAKPAVAVAGDEARLQGRRAQILVGWAPAAYRYDGTPCTVFDGDCTPPSDAAVTAYDYLKTQIRAPALGSFSVRGEVFPGQDYVGPQISYTRLSYQTDFGANTGSGTDHCSTHFCDSMNWLFAGVQGRIPLLKQKGPLDVMLRIGYQFQDAVQFRRVFNAATNEKTPRFQTLNLHGLRGGFGLRYTVIPQIQPHFDYEFVGALGASLTDGEQSTTFGFSGVTDHHIALGSSFKPWKGLLVDFTYDITLRNLGLRWTDEQQVSQRGTSEEQAHVFRLSAGWAF